MTSTPSLSIKQSLLSGRTYIALSIGMAAFLFQLITNAVAAYGIFRDEFYYLACADRLAWGYVDQPPLSIALLWLQRLLFGDSLLALRLAPALAIGVTVYLCGRMTARLGGNNLAVFLACVSCAFVPILLAMGSFYSMNSLDILLWSATAYHLIRLTDKPSRQNWLILGLLLGLGLLNKISFLWLGAGMGVGLLFAPLRKSLITPAPYLAALIALLIFSAYLVWNAVNDWPHLEFARNAVSIKYAGISRLDFISGVMLQQNPLTLLLWLPGLYYFLFHPKGKRYRVLGIVFLIVAGILLINGRSKAEYLAPAFPMLFAGGAVCWQQWAAHRTWLLTVICLLIFSSNLLLAPLGRPLLPPDTFVRYAAAIGIATKNSEGKLTGALPQFFADRFGWPELAAAVAEVYTSLPDAEKDVAYAYGQNYGEAGALEYYSRHGLSLPPVLSGHNNYWLWGRRLGQLPTVLIGIGGELEGYQAVYAEVEQVGLHNSRYAMPYETQLPIYLCRNPRLPFAEIWPQAKHYD